jgi:hypothetical protein
MNMKIIHYLAAAVVTGALALGLGCGPTEEEFASEELESIEASLLDGGGRDAGTVDAGTGGPADAGTVDAGTGGPADAGSGRKKVSCATNTEKCSASPEPDCSCRTETDKVCVNAYGEYCEW